MIDFERVAQGEKTGDPKQKPKAAPPKTGQIITLNTADFMQLEYFKKDAELIKTEGMKIKVVGDITKIKATDYGSRAHKALKQFHEHVAKILNDAKDYVDKGKNVEKMLAKPVEELIAYLKGELKQHKARETLAAAKRAEAARKATAELQKKLNEEAKASGIKEEIKVDAIVTPGVDNITRAESGTSFGTKRPKVTVVDLEKVPREYIKKELRLKAVHDAMRQGVTHIDGLELDWEEDISFK